MYKKLVFAAAIAVLPVSAMAANVGECGWGSKLFDGQQGIAPQVLAVTTNGTSGNQTFGISTGTSGCTQNGVVRSNWKTAMFIEKNKTKLSQNMSVGHGEALDSLASLMGVSKADKPVFEQVAKENFSKVFPSTDVSTKQVMASLREVLKSNERLSQYATAV
ncbi:MAG TPA: DUF3015 domain-containing protein [Gammaproteobacteria bacterium]|nr:DUF3015 domain-containing protein [Gammaproteobacteria bacterium]